MANHHEQEIAALKARQSADKREIRRLERENQRKLMSTPVPTRTEVIPAKTVVTPTPVKCQKCKSHPALTEELTQKEKQAKELPLDKPAFRYVSTRGKALCNWCIQALPLTPSERDYYEARERAWEEYGQWMR